MIGFLDGARVAGFEPILHLAAGSVEDLLLLQSVDLEPLVALPHFLADEGTGRQQFLNWRLREVPQEQRTLLRVLEFPLHFVEAGHRHRLPFQQAVEDGFAFGFRVGLHG